MNHPFRQNYGVFARNSLYFKPELQGFVECQSGNSNHLDEFEGVEMPNCVQKIIPRERLQVDADRLAEVYLRVGTERGEQRVERTLTDLTCLLDHLRAVSRTGRLGATARSAGQLHSAAETLGLTSLQRVATDVQRLCQTHDPTALNAVLMRLDRVADSSIKVISELQAEIS